MHHSIRGIGWIAGLALLLALVAAMTPTGVGAQGARASITIYKSQCPIGYEGTNFFEDCYPNAMEGITFTLTPDGGTAATAVTGASGFTAFEDLGGGTYVLSEEIPGDFNDFVAFCSAGGETFPFEYATDVSGIVLDLTTADDLRCDFYSIPAEVAEETPAPTVTPAKTPTTTTTVAQLPSTGAGTSSSVTTGTFALAGLLAAFGIGLVGFSWQTRSAHRTR